MKIVATNAYRNQTIQANQPNFSASLRTKSALIPGHLIGPVRIDQDGNGWYVVIDHALQAGKHVCAILVRDRERGQKLIDNLAVDIDKASNPNAKGIIDIRKKLEKATAPV